MNMIFIVLQNCFFWFSRVALARRNFHLKYDTNIPRQVVSVYNHASCMSS